MDVDHVGRERGRKSAGRERRRSPIGREVEGGEFAEEVDFRRHPRQLGALQVQVTQRVVVGGERVEQLVDDGVAGDAAEVDGIEFRRPRRVVPASEIGRGHADVSQTRHDRHAVELDQRAAVHRQVE